MKIRSVTCFIDPNRAGEMQSAAGLARDAVSRFSEAGYEVQTTRLATPPFPRMLSALTVENVVQLARRLEAESAANGFAYLSIGPTSPDELEAYTHIPAALAATQNTFLTGIMADARQGVSLPAVRACAQVIARAAPITPDGFANLRFAALANVPAHVPFFPSAFHDGQQPAFGLAMECADEAVAAFTNASTLAEGRQRLIERLNSQAEKLGPVAAELAERYGLLFKGFDFSLAPFPEDWCSLGGAMEALGVPAVGLLGSVSAAAVLADTLDQGVWPRCGFNGMMLPVLEDSVMARRSGVSVGVKDLLLISTVCGAGLDTVPLPGDASEDELYALLLDVAVLAVRLGKPLTARLMPVPGKKAGEMTAFDFDFFANGRIMDLPARAIQGHLAGEENIPLTPRRK